MALSRAEKVLWWYSVKEVYAIPTSYFQNEKMNLFENWLF